jgi:error-prone DNA polymerase
VDVLHSDWDCTVELGAMNQPAVRLGLRMVKGLSQEGAQRLIAARTPLLPNPESRILNPESRILNPDSRILNPESRFPNPESRIPNPDPLPSFIQHANLNRRDLTSLAAANAFASIAGHRRNAAWLVAGIERMPPVLETADVSEQMPLLAAPTAGQDVVADYASVGLTLGPHPLALLRARLKRMRLITAQELKALPDGRFARTAGIVTCRQHPDTAKGTIFVTLEDETGFTNVVVWSHVSVQQRRELLQSRLMGVHGTVQKEGEVIHLVARRLFDHSALLGKLVTQSRDFH